jgi:hypothetical protein
MWALCVMKYSKIIDAQKGKLIVLDVRKIDHTRIMIQGDTDSLLYLSDYIREHALTKGCEADVPLKVNLLDTPLGENEFELFLHSLPCDEIEDT